MKTCNACQEDLPLDEFGKESNSKDGRQSRCKPCRRARQKELRDAKADEINAKRREKYASDPEYRARKISQVKTYQRGTGKEKRTEYDRARVGAPGRTWKEWADKNGNRERKRQEERDRYQTDPDFQKRKKLAAAVRNHMTSEGDLTTQQWREILDEYDDLCAYCDEPYSHIEHVLPLSRGGQHTASNVVPACSACNLSKGAKTPDEWISQLN